MLLKRRPKNEDLRPLGLKRRPYGLKRRPHGLKRRPHGLKRRPLGLKRRPHGLKRLMLTAEGNARSRNLLRRFGNVVEFPLQYLVVILKSITYLSFRFLCGKYFALDCSQSPIFSWDRLDIPRLTVTGILIFKCTEGAGVGDYSSGWGDEKPPPPLSSFDTHARWQPVTQSARSRWSYGKIEDCEQSNFACFKPLWKWLRWRWRQFYLNQSFLQGWGERALVAKW